MSNYPRLDDNGLLYLLQQLKLKMESMLPGDMTGASASSNGAHGLVPQPNQGQESQYLRGDGSWATPPGTPNTIETISVNGTNVPPDVNKNVNITTPSAPVQSVSKNGTAITPDANGNVNMTVPTATSDLTNDSDYQNSIQVQAAIDAKVSAVLKPSGSILFANLPSLTASNCNKIFDIQDSFTTTADFIEGSGVNYPAHTNVAIINVGTDASPVYKYDTYGSLIDTSSFVLASEMTTISNSEIDAIIATAFGS